MPRFYFNIHDGKTIIDKEGTELPNWQAARTEAIRYAGEVLRHEADSLGLGEDWRLEVIDHTGLILFQMTEAPTVLQQIDRGKTRE